MRGNLKEGMLDAQGVARGLDGTLKGLQNTVVGLFAADKVTDFVHKIMDVRGEVEALQISFETLAGTTKGRELFGDIRSFAVNTPMMMQDLAKGAQTLLGFNIEAEKVMPILRQIGDISMGDAQKFNSLTLAFAQMSSTGKLMGQDLLQMINAGFNPLTVIAQKTGKSIGQLKDEMSAGKITVEMVADAFETATAEGGKFHGMLEKQSKGLKGAMSNLEGAWEDALNEMGEKGEGVMVDVIDLTAGAIKNYDKLGTAILTVVAAYGEYKGSLMAIEAWQNTIAKQKETIEADRVSELQSLVDEYKASLDTGAIDAETAATQANTAAKEGNATAINAEIAAIENELRAKLAAAEANAASAFADHEIANQMVDDAIRKVAAAQEELDAAVRSGDAKAIESAQEKLNTAVKERDTAEEIRNAAAKNSTTAYTQKQTAAQKLNTFQTQVDTIQKDANTKATGLWAAATNLCTKAMHGLKDAFMSNPFGIALVAITSIIGLLSMFSFETDDAADSVDRFRKKVMEEQSQLDSYYAVLTHVEKGTKSYKTALEGINALAREYNVEQIGVNDTLEEQKEKYDALTDAIRRQAAEKTLAEAAAKANEDAMNAEKEAMDDLIDAAEDASYKVVKQVMTTTPEGVTTKMYDAVDEASTHIRQVTTATWNMISTDVMAHAQQISEAFAKSSEDGKKAVEEEVTAIEGILRALGATDQEIEAFHDDLYDYVETSAKGFTDAYSELERTQAQLEGIANQVVQTKDTTNDAIDKMNYEQLVQKVQEVENEIETTKAKIDEANAKKVDIQTDTRKLEDLKQLLIEINALIPDKLTEGSEADLQRRLKDAQDRRTNAVPGSEEWNAANKEVGQLNGQLTKLRGLHAETVSRRGRGSGVRGSGRGGSGGRSGSGSRGDSVAEQKRKQQRYLELQREQEQERRRQAEDLAFETRQHEIDIMEEGNEKVLAQIELDYKKRKAEIERAYEDLKQAKIDAARKAFEANPANKDKVFDPSTVDTSYTEEETRERQKADEANEKQRLRATEAVYEAERQSMRDFLKEYGNYQQRKQAIAEDYAERIRKAQTEGERLRLQKELEEQQRAEQTAINEYLLLYGSYQQKKLALNEEYAHKISKAKNAGERLQLERELEEKLSELDMSQFEKSINWEAVFNGLDKLSLEHLKKLKEQLKEALNAKDITAENAAVISERINTVNGQIQRKSNEWQNAFGLVIPELEEIHRLERESEEAQERLEQAKRRQTEVLKEEAGTRREILELLKKEGIEADESQITATGQDAFIGQLQGQGKDVTQLTNLFSKLGKQERAVTKSTEELSQAEVEAGMAAEAAGSRFASTVAIIDAIVHGINDNVQSAKELFEQMDLADTKFGKGWSAFAESSQYATDAWESLKSGNIMGVANGVYGSLRTLGNALGEWGVSGFGNSDTNLVEDIERLTQSNKDLEQAIASLADELGDARMSDVDALYEQQKRNILDVERNTQEMMSRTGAAYGKGFLGIGGHHSSNKKINDGMSSAEWDAISQLLGKNVRSAADFWALSSKEMYEVATKLTSEYSHLKDLAGDGYKDASEFMDDYITCWKELEDIENAYREKMTGLSFDSVRSSFNSLVKEVKNGTKEMLSSVDDMFEDAILNWLMSESYSDRLQGWYEKFAEYMKDGLEKWEADELRSWYGSIFDDMNRERVAAYDAAGIEPDGDGTTQSGKAGAFETMTQDQGTKLEGLFTSGQIHWASMDEQLGKIADRWGGLLDRLGELVENTSYCRHLAEIADDIKAMHRDGIKMR